MSETGTPKVYANVVSGNLLRQVHITDGIAGIIGTASVAGNIGKVQTVYSLKDAVSKGYTESSEPFLYRQISEFYQELGGDQELWVLGTEDTMTLESALTSTNEKGVQKLLTLSQGRVNLVGVCRKPAKAYVPPAGFLDKDVENALKVSKTLAQFWQSINRPIRILIEGRVVNEKAPSPFKPNSASNTYAGVILGGSVNDGSASVGLALGRACKYPGHIKLGNGQNGALSISKAYIGNRKIEEFTPTELDTLSDAGYIILHTREGTSGYYYSVDHMAGNDDFHILVHGRLIDKAQRIAIAANTQFLETSIRMDANGKLHEADAKYIEDIIKVQLRKNMADQVSGLDVIVPSNQDLINSSTITIQVKIQPLGYLTWIVVNLGLTKTL